MTHTQTQGADGAGTKTGGFVYVAPDGVPFWPSTKPTEAESRKACFGPCDEWRLSDLKREGWRCEPITLGASPAPAATPGVPDSLREALAEVSSAVSFAHNDYMRLGDYGGWDRLNAAECRLREMIEAIAAQPAGQAGDAGAETDALVDRFAAALKVKLRAAEAKYGWKKGWLKSDWQVECQNGLLRHVGKGDPLDVAAYAAFCWHHGWPSASRRSTDFVTGAVIPTAGAIAAYETRYPEGSLSETSDNAIEAWNRVAAAVLLADKPAPNSTRTGAAEAHAVFDPALTTSDPYDAMNDLRDAMRPVLLERERWGDARFNYGDHREVWLKLGAVRRLCAAYDALAARPEAPSDAGWRSQAADEIDAIADLWSGDGRSYAKTIAAILRSEEPEQLPPADAETKRQVQRAWERFKAGTSTPPSDPAPSGQAEG